MLCQRKMVAFWREDPFHSYSNSKKGKIEQNLRSSRRIPTSMRLPRNLLVVKENGREQGQFPMPTSTEETS